MHVCGAIALAAALVAHSAALSVMAAPTTTTPAPRGTRQLPPPSPPPSLTCSLVDPVTKIRPRIGVFASPAPYVLRAARNEYESVQVACTSGTAVVTITGAQVAVPSGWPEAQVYRQVAYESVNASDCVASTGAWPDALIPDKDVFDGQTRNAFPMQVVPGNTSALWIDLFVPPETDPGDVPMTITLAVSTSQTSGAANAAATTARTAAPTASPTQAQASKHVLNFTAHIWNFTLPSTSPYATEFGFSVGGALTAFYGANAKEHEAEAANITRQWQELAMMHRVTLGAWMPESQLPNVTGPAPTDLDWSGFEAAWGSFLNGHTLPWGLRGAKVTSAQVAAPFETNFVNGSATSQAQQKQYWAAVTAYFDKRGNASLLYDYTQDEPHLPQQWEALRARAAAVHDAVPSGLLRVLSTLEADSAAHNNVTFKDVDLWVPIINWVDVKGLCYRVPGNNRHAYDDAASLWWYQSCQSDGCAPEPCNSCQMGWPTYMIDHPGPRNRVMGWMTYAYQMQGELYWGTNAAMRHMPDPWGQQYLAGGNGDGTMTYAGTPDRIGGSTNIPLPSIRLKLVRDGQEDLMYMWMLEQLQGSRDGAMAIVGRVVASTYSYAADAAAMMAARAALGEAIEAADSDPRQ